MRTPLCYIDECANPATLILHTYPDRTLLCDGHKHLVDTASSLWDGLAGGITTAKECSGPGCDVCEAEGSGR